MSKKPSIAYMHTLDGRPASYDPGLQIVMGAKDIRLCKDMKQIRAERSATKKWRKAHGCGPCIWKIGVQSVRLP